MRQIDVFSEIPCLTERSNQLSGLFLQKKWFRSADKRVIAQYLQKFISYNSSGFEFLGVEPFTVGTDANASLVFRTSSYIGSVPLRASDTGKQIGDFVVVPRYSGQSRFENYIEILNLLGGKIGPEVVDSLPLASGRNFRPPLYLEAVRYVSGLEGLLKTHWHKFDSLEVLSDQPLGRVNWKLYFNSEYKVEKRLKFETRRNILSEFHAQYSEIRYVFDLCKNELLSANTPFRLRNALRSRLMLIEERLRFHKAKWTDKIAVRAADSPVVRLVKEQANKILGFNFSEGTAWRVDFSDVFEKFVQYIFQDVAKETGGRLFTNMKFYANSRKGYTWKLSHVEPDAIYQKGDLLVFIDAKYKSNLYNKFGSSQLLKEDHRHDIHQIMAYSSFSETWLKYGFLCYPAERFELNAVSYRNGINSVTNSITIVGIPFKIESVKEVKNELISLISSFS